MESRRGCAVARAEEKGRGEHESPVTASGGKGLEALYLYIWRNMENSGPAF